MTRREQGFTLVEVLVALVVVALGLAALMVAVQGAARTSGYLRDKTLAQWVALNRIAEVRLTASKSTGTSKVGGTTNNDTGQLDFAGRTWHYDTRYFDTTFPTMKRIVVRVWAGDAKTKGSPITETMSFYGTSLGQPGVSNTDWTVGTTLATACNSQQTTSGVVGGANVPGQATSALQTGVNPNCTPANGTPGIAPVGQGVVTTAPVTGQGTSTP
jgi:general secretion pathway protein I